MVKEIKVVKTWNVPITFEGTDLEISYSDMELRDHNRFCSWTQIKELPVMIDGKIVMVASGDKVLIRKGSLVKKAWVRKIPQNEILTAQKDFWVTVKDVLIGLEGYMIVWKGAGGSRNRTITDNISGVKVN